MSTTLEQQLFLGSHTHFTAALTLGRKVPHSFPPQEDLSNPRIPTLQITSPDHLLVPGTSSGVWSAVLPECALQEKRDYGSIAVLPRALTATHIQTTKKLFGVGMPPWILIIERFLGHTRFISGKQGPTSDFQHPVTQKYTFLRLCDVY